MLVKALVLSAFLVVITFIDIDPSLNIGYCVDVAGWSRSSSESLDRERR